ncbi:Pimeloyl-ACP methyl ester carboxylesterase [Nocardioides terrae]|uniref:Pimeloyl-ACP methyl ester carboxylesterase n=1 Tax=Nocardioides terrae TaxID=574651 RepID=A0A1I1LBH1_9ACTN|nr:Pimeloyl-ACP methyl ester carboxylesterase [Nocardioides terrae]
MFVHGFGCGQDMWRHVAPAFEDDFRVVLFDLPGSGAAAPSTYDPVRHGSLEGYRDDVIALLDEVGLSSVVLVGHSVSAMIAVLVQIARPDLVERLVLVTPSARYLDDGSYVGGFSGSDIDELLDLMSRNHLGWQNPLAALVAGPDSPSVQDELERTFCRTRPEVAAEFAAVTFRGDNRADLPHVSVPTLVLQSREDSVAPMSAGLYVRDNVPDCELEVLETLGHCPQLTAPEETAKALRSFVGRARTERTA